MDLFQPDRHEALVAREWDADEAHAAIRDIATSTLSAFDPEKLWPSHPLDALPDGFAGIYLGATGNMLALDFLKRAGAIDATSDFKPLLPSIVERDNLWLKLRPYGAYGSLLMGDLGTHLVAMRLAPDAATAERVYSRARNNNDLPPLELLWGMAGSMLACVEMDALTGEPRFEALFREQAALLLSDIQSGPPCRLWRVDLDNRKARFLGLIHGFAGNIHALVQGWQWLTDAQRQFVSEISHAMLAATARQSGSSANWPKDIDARDEPMLCQMCHGAPGILTAFAAAPFSTLALERLLVKGGELVWSAGPLKKGSNFCHGTGGNAYSLLKLYRRTGDTIWLARARTLAMHAIGQFRAAQKRYGRVRYSLWTGDTGLAVCLWCCITGEAKFPAFDAI